MNLKKAAQKKLRKSGGFTLVEMLIVVAIIAILLVVSIPMVSSSLDKARTATDDANERSAKAAALIEYMTGDVKPDTSDKYYYDAANGIVKAADTGIAGYNQAVQGTNDRGTAIVVVKITDDGTNEFKAEPSWEPAATS